MYACRSLTLRTFPVCDQAFLHNHPRPKWHKPFGNENFSVSCWWPKGAKASILCHHALGRLTWKTKHQCWNVSYGCLRLKHVSIWIPAKFTEEDSALSGVHSVHVVQWSTNWRLLNYENPFPGRNRAYHSARESLNFALDHSQTVYPPAASARKSACKACRGDRTQKQLTSMLLGAIRGKVKRLPSGTVSSVQPGNKRGWVLDQACGSWSGETWCVGHWSCLQFLLLGCLHHRTYPWFPPDGLCVEFW